MQIIIKIESKTVELLLSDASRVMDSFRFEEERQLSEKLLPGIDALLEKNGISPKDVEKIEVRSDVGENFTTFRIAQSVANAWNWSQGVDNFGKAA